MIRVRYISILVVSLMLIVSVTLSAGAFSLSYSVTSASPCPGGYSCCITVDHHCGSCVGPCLPILNVRTLGIRQEKACWNYQGQMTSWESWCVFGHICEIQHC